jgi:hypothetical protein
VLGKGKHLHPPLCPRLVLDFLIYDMGMAIVQNTGTILRSESLEEGQGHSEKKAWADVSSGWLDSLLDPSPSQLGSGSHGKQILSAQY